MFRFLYRPNPSEEHLFPWVFLIRSKKQVSGTIIIIIIIIIITIIIIIIIIIYYYYVHFYYLRILKEGLVAIKK